MMKMRYEFLLLFLFFLARNSVSEDLEESDEEVDTDSFEVDDDGRIYKNPRNSPSLQCPRDEDQAVLMGQKCLRKCSTDEDCKSKKKKCMCDGICGMSCIKPERECAELTHPSRGSVTVTGRLFGDRATYSCTHGTHVVGLVVRTCQADGNWSGGTPVCKENVYCKTPPLIDHSRHSALPTQTTFDIDASLTYSCYPGYNTRGFPTAKCLEIEGTASWFGPDFSCEPLSCGTPADTAHGWHAGECYTFGCRVAYHCADGYQIVGRGERYCQGDGAWSPKELPTCVLVTAVQCAAPESPPHGQAVFTSSSYNSVVSYECKYGYTLSGTPTRKCGADKKWSGQMPQCKAPCVVPGIQQGRVSLASNALVVAGRNETLINGTTVVQHGELLSVDCDLNYEFLPSDNRPVSCNNGTWTHIPRCEPARCKRMPKPPRNGMVIAPKTDHGMKARYKCKDGYTLRGANTTECLYGNWTGTPPYCQEVYCPFPGYIENGKVMLVGNMGLYDYRPYVRKVTNNKQIMYDCDRGYILADGPPGATCIGGRWSPKALPRCVPGLHPRLRWSRSVRSVRLRALVAERNAAELVRLEAERDNGDAGVMDANQGSTALTRVKRAMVSGTHTQQKQTQLGGQRGKEPVGRKGNKNQKGGRGKMKGVKGKPGPCEPLSNEPFTTVTVIKLGKNENQTHSQGSVVLVTCGKGYGLNIGFNVTARCTRGMWKPDYPECEILPCRVPMTPHGLFREAGATSLLNLTQDILNGEVVQFSCRHGYNVKGPGNLRCWHGEWAITSQPECSPSPCELPQITHGQYLNGYRAGLTIANGSNVQFQCDSDYSKSTAKPVECVLGELRPRTPACRLHHRNLAARRGSDISKAGEVSEIDFPMGYRRTCGPPARVQGSLVFRDGEPLEDSERSFTDGTEVTFNCIATIMGERTTWRIVCEDGSWVGRSLSCEDDDLLDMTHGAFRNSSCMFRNAEPNLATFYNDQHITEEFVEFPGGSVLVSRCVDIGKYSMIGSTARKCVGGEWDGHKPVCFGLNQENDYALEKPPTILLRHQLGPIAQSNDGKLIVYPGTILHMECLWVRRFGTPKWNVSHSYRKYPEGWVTDPARDPQLEYRLSIYHASKDDSGTFTCITPTRHTHYVDIIVQAVHCPVIPPRKGLTLSSSSTKLNTHVLFNCDNGNSLIGAQELACLPSGNWSGPFPICESVECADLANMTDPHLRVSILSRGVGGRAVFSCGAGYGLRGPVEVVCQPSGDWSTPLPTCQEVQCSPPPTPDNGYIQGSGPYKAGDVIQFNCNPEFMMQGQPIIACQESSRWSGVVPKCIQACSYPGTTINGRMSDVKFYYRIGESVTFTCDPGMDLRGTPMLRCLRNGKWSNAIPTCVATTTEPSLR